MKELLNVVNENDEVVGEEAREDIHRDGLLHREIHVYFITPNKEVIFQHRAKDKDTYPDMLDAAVGGHVEIGDSYEKTAIKEAYEETGVEIDVSDLVFLGKRRIYLVDEKTGKINNTINQSYVYTFQGKIEDLRIEEGKSLGFELWPIDKLLAIDQAGAEKFIPYILEFSKTKIVDFINESNI
jgi:isopentenyldiphosphate isomerase